MPVLEMACDIAELERTAVEQFIYANQRLNAGERADQVVPPEVSPAHLGWVNYLVEVERAVKRAPALAASLSADVVSGLAVLDAAREEFRRRHKQCPHCGRWVSRFAGRCVCSKEM